MIKARKFLYMLQNLKDSDLKLARNTLFRHDSDSTNSSENSNIVEYDDGETEDKEL